jgi:hypothetical protein
LLDNFSFYGLVKISLKMSSLNEFDDSIDFESKICSSSYQDGFDIGRVRGDADGHALGFEHGFALGSELAQYDAFVAAMTLVPSMRNAASARCQSAVEALAMQLRTFRAATTNDALQVQVQQIRSLFKKAASLAHISASGTLHQPAV